MDLSLSFACCGYLDRTSALQTGVVAPQGIELTYQELEVAELFRRVAQDAEFDIAEMSVSTYMMMLADGDERFVGIPVFPSRAFRHNMVFVNTECGIRRPEDLVGKTIGLPEYQMTAGVWVRSFLLHDYGVEPSSIAWRYGGIYEPQYSERWHFEPPPDVDVAQIPAGKALVPMFEAGELDAFITFDPAAHRDSAPRIQRLFPNYREVERDYFERTGFFPIMHMIVIRRDVYEANRWTATSMMDALIAAKRIGRARMHNFGMLAVALPWLESELEEVAALFAGDPFPYGFKQNRAILDAIAQYSYEQGLTNRKLEPEELFVPEALEHPGDGPA